MIRPSASEDRNIPTVAVLLAAYSDLKYISDQGRTNFRRFYDLAEQERPNPVEFIEAFWRLPAVWQLILEPMLSDYGVKMVGARLV